MCRSQSWVHHFLEQLLDGGGNRSRGVHDFMDSPRIVAVSHGIDGRHNYGIFFVLHPRDGLVESDGGDLSSYSVSPVVLQFHADLHPTRPSITPTPLSRGCRRSAGV
jgi:hypothetical protein